MKIAKTLIDENEGNVLTVYRCPAGKLTIGRGRNLEDRGITHEESDYLLRNDVAEAHSRLSSEFAFYKGLSEIRQAVLIDMYHNLGLTGLLGFRKMLTALRNGDWHEAAEQVRQSRYWSQVGVRAMRNYCMLKFDRYYTREEARRFFEEDHFGI